MASNKTEEPKLTLPTGHPEAGYVSPDLSFSDTGGPVPDAEKEWADERDSARKTEVEAVAAHEDEVAKAEAAAAEEAAAEPAPTTTKATTSKTSSSS